MQKQILLPSDFFFFFRKPQRVITNTGTYYDDAKNRGSSLLLYLQFLL